MKASTWRDVVERRFEAVGHWVFRNRLKTLTAMLLLVAGLASQLRNITIRTASDSPSSNIAAGTFAAPNNSLSRSTNSGLNCFGEILIAILGTSIACSLKTLKAFRKKSPRQYGTRKQQRQTRNLILR